MSRAAIKSISTLHTAVSARRLASTYLPAVRAAAHSSAYPSTPRGININRQFSSTPNKMAQSIINAAATAAHSAFASIAAASPIKAGDNVPDVEIRVNDLEDKVNFSKLTGKNVLVLVPGAFSPDCSSQVPSYIDLYDSFKEKGVQDVYVVAVNDMFCLRAWKEKLSRDTPTQDTPIKFAGDATGALCGALGIVVGADVQKIFGGPRFQRGVVVIENGKVLSVVSETSPGNITVTDAAEVLKTL